MADFLSRTADCNEATAVAFDPVQSEDLSSNTSIVNAPSGADSVTKLQKELKEARDINILLFEGNKKLLAQVNELISISEASSATSTWPIPDKERCLITLETPLPRCSLSQMANHLSTPPP